MPACSAAAVDASHRRRRPARKPEPRRRLLGQLDVAAVAVEADRGSAHEHACRTGLGQAVGQEVVGVHPAVEDPILLGPGPPAGQPLAGQVDGAVDVSQ